MNTEQGIRVLSCSICVHLWFQFCRKPAQNLRVIDFRGSRLVDLIVPRGCQVSTGDSEVIDAYRGPCTALKAWKTQSRIANTHWPPSVATSLLRSPVFQIETSL